VAQLVALCFQLAPLLVDREQAIEVDVRDPLRPDGLAHHVGVLADELPAKHGSEFLRRADRRIASLVVRVF